MRHSDLELVEKNPLARGFGRAVLGLATQNLQPNAQIEPQPLVFRFLDHKRLKRREIVRQQRHRRAEHSCVPQLAQQKVDRQRQFCRGQYFFANRSQHFLAGTFSVSRSPSERKKWLCSMYSSRPSGASGDVAELVHLSHRLYNRSRVCTRE